MKFDPKHLCAIFGNPRPPKVIWEEQFDFCNKQLQKMGKMPWQEIPESDLWYYIHDLNYVELQPELFAHLFPVCLKFWYDTLMRNESAEMGDSCLHRALLKGEILQKMVTPKQREAIYNFMHDAFIERLVQERCFIYVGSQTAAYGWIARFVSLGLVTPLIERIWNSWWSFDSPGKAVCAVTWASGLIYWPDENPIFSRWTPNGGGGGPYLSESDSGIYDSVWLPENTSFLKLTLTHDYLEQKMDEAAEYLRAEPEYELARRIADDAAMNSETFELKRDVLFEELTKPYNHDPSAW